MNPNFVGKVDIYIYFGTKYDLLNIPYWSNQIEQQATKTIHKQAQAVWQTTWLTSVKINVEDYQDIVGAQFVKIVEVGTGTQYNGAHWYNVMDYFQVSQKCAQLTIGYNPLLSMQIGHITGINGIMQRWTVDNDALFRWTYTPEPINQAAPYVYSYQSYNAATDTYIPLAGFPYDMSHLPDVKVYTSEESVEGANILYPTLTPLMGATQFRTSVGGGSTLKDGLRYYRWNTVEGDAVYENYNAAIGLGFDLVNNSYCLPASSIINIVFSGTGASTITGGTTTFNPGYGLTDGGYHNSKAGELGKFFTLYNTVSGDSITVKNYELNNTSVTICVNPYSDGCFMARFSNYMKDTSTYSGYVKSPTYPRISMAGNTGVGTMVNQLNNTIDVGNLDIMQRAENANITTGRMNAEMSMINSLGSSFIQFMGGAMQFTDDMSSGIGNMMGGVSGIGNALTTRYNTKRSLDTAQANLDMTVGHQREVLRARGDLGQAPPASFKLANSFVSNGNAYTFNVRQCTLAASDRQRADRFFTAYGYNVDHNPLDNVSQLACRQRFTFIQADDVEIVSVGGGTDLTRLRDTQTNKYIQSLFSSGIRIWKTEPDYNFSLENPVTGGG